MAKYCIIMSFETKEDTVFDIKTSLFGYLKCLNKTELEDSLLNDKIIAWLSSEHQIFNPSNKFVLDPCSESKI